jgi:acetylornithine/succinyldiaminopimelate/putrescine aminotransferase
MKLSLSDNTMKENPIFFNNHLAHTTMFPLGLKITHAEGIYVIDENGRKYMDMVSGIGVSNLGHGVKYITEAIKTQVDKHLHVMVYGEYEQSAQSRAGRALCNLLPEQLNCAYFVNSGTEANEAALKLAKRVTRRSRIVSCKGAYHGSTHGSLSVSSNEIKKAAFRPLLPDVYFIRFGVIEDLELIDENTACLIMETIQGDAGIRIPTAEYMQAVRKRCTEVGAMLILDEIQAGMGRTGTMFAFEQYDIVPDILTLGKALGGGMPIGCMVSSQEKMRELTYDPQLGHISTFAGHPVVCASAAACIEYMVENKIVDDVERKGRYIAERLRQMPGVIEVRQRGLFFAIDMTNADIVSKVVTTCLEKGLISFWFLSCPSSFRIAPPLTITDEEIDQALAIIGEAVGFK